MLFAPCCAPQHCTASQLPGCCWHCVLLNMVQLIHLLLLVQVLLGAGADAFAVDEGGTNALLLAASCGSAGCVQQLLAEGVDADYHNSDLGAGEHALLAAAAGGWVQCVQLLLAGGARVNRADKEGRTALWVASR